MLNALFVGMGGFFGAVFRYLLGLLPVKNQSAFPVVTLCVNLAGAFIIGLVAACCAKKGVGDTRAVLFLRVGLCGGFTTFSTFSLETFSLFENGRPALAMLYVLSSVVLCIGAVFCAKLLVR